MPGEVEPQIIVINGFGDLMSDVFTGDNAEIEIEGFFEKFIQWEQLLCRKIS